MKFNLDKKLSDSIENFKASIPKRLENFGRAIGQDLSRRAAGMVANKITGSGPWISTYRGAIQYRETEDGLNFAVAGLTEVKLFHKADERAATTLVDVTGSTEAGRILQSFRPWPIDTIPAFIFGEAAVARQGSEEDVAGHRARTAPLKALVAEMLKNAGVSEAGDWPLFTQGEYFDIAFMARAMELGLPGYDRRAHWSVVAPKIAAFMDKLPSSARMDANAALEGREFPAVHVMSPTESANLSRIREETWP